VSRGLSDEDSFAPVLHRQSDRTTESEAKKGTSMRRLFTTGAVVALGLGVWGCNGSGYGNQNSVNPTTPTGAPSTSGVVTVNVVGINGSLSFSPNPATLPVGQMIVWHNVDTITHHVVFDDRSVDTGDLAPGAFSQLETIPAGRGPYHCSIHPVMVGSVNQDVANAPAPCQGSSCY
jgi:plastocyanin